MHRTLCICALIPRLITRTRLVLILHQLEHRKTTNTGRLAARCLINSQVTGTHLVTPGAAPSEAWLDDDRQPLLLFPHAEARPLEDWAGSPRPITLVVPDGTWRQANKARRRLEGLGQLPCVKLPEDGARSDYQLRHDARPDHLATIEAVAVAMGILEGPEVRQQLQHIFRVMVDRTLWTNGRIAAHAVTGGIPAGVRSHDPLGVG
jgi:DTW domain-containing protein YfiP